jgi:hypothetical protein
VDTGVTVTNPVKNLLLLCARLELSEAERGQLAELLKQKSLDWQGLLHNVRWHRLSGLVYHHLRQTDLLCTIPDEAAAELKATYVQNTVKNIFMRSELRKVLRGLEKNDIPVIVLKGGALLELVYVNPALRYMSDIDLLVPDNLAEEAQSIVRGFGYHPVGTPEAQERARQNHRHLPSLVNHNRTAAFEVHSHIVTRDSPLRFELEGFWSRATRASIAEQDVLVLAPEDMLTHLAIHFFLDRRFRSYAALSQLCDMAEVIRARQEDIDWSFLAREAIDNGVRGAVYCGISLAQQLLDAPVPENILQGLRPPGFSRSSAERFTRRRILDTRPVLASSLVAPISGYSLSSLTKSIVTRLFPNKKYMSEHYVSNGGSRNLYGSYAHRVGEAGSVVMQYLRNPLDLWQQFQVDRWIHSVQNEASNNGRS